MTCSVQDFKFLIIFYLSSSVYLKLLHPVVILYLRLLLTFPLLFLNAEHILCNFKSVTCISEITLIANGTLNLHCSFRGAKLTQST